MSPTPEQRDLLYHFYTTERIYDIKESPLALEDQGGPFGFDIHFALEVDYLVRTYGCKEIVETGTYSGDTTEYLAKQYPHLKILSCEIEPTLYEFARQRLSQYPNVTVVHESSDHFLQRIIKNQQTPMLERPFFYLDAHSSDVWPLQSELEAICETSWMKGCIVCIGDCDIGDDRYGFDQYDGIPCDAQLLTELIGSNTVLYANHPNASYPFPCLQMERRSGRMYFLQGDLLNPTYMEQCPYLVPIAYPCANTNKQ